MSGMHPVIALEQNALRRWCNGDPSGFLEISAPDVTYFDPFIGERLDGFDNLRTYYDGIRGKIFAQRHRMIDPCILEIGKAAILTFRFNSSGSEGAEMRWNCTEVYRNDPEGWRIVQTHWSFTGQG